MWPACPGVACPWNGIKIILMTRTMMMLMVILTLMWILMTKPPGNEQHSNSRPVLPMLEVRSVKPW